MNESTNKPNGRTSNILKNEYCICTQGFGGGIFSCHCNCVFVSFSHLLMSRNKSVCEASELKTLSNWNSLSPRLVSTFTENSSTFSTTTVSLWADWVRLAGRIRQNTRILPGKKMIKKQNKTKQFQHFVSQVTLQQLLVKMCQPFISSTML